MVKDAEDSESRLSINALSYYRNRIGRGNNREPVFQEKEDFEKYLEICRRYKDQYEFKLYHWVLMNNHVHLLIETSVGNKGKGTKYSRGGSLTNPFLGCSSLIHF